MLDSNTKRKIDNARDILVGKVPVPKAQIDLITITLIYKFMDDMDRQAEELGGKASFFVRDYEKYAWGKVMSQSLSGYERLQLFDEGLIKMNQNPHIPELFRDIFKNAFLPFRDPETLNMFLEELNGFEYSHSEKLGDAFEYLLSIMSSQGDAGQFRTPRHIIEFIVDIVNPTKTDTILDPACGTAGFLISAFKHIMEENTEDYFGDMLNSDEREKIVKNIVGYDISPDMVRLSLVNMFLHKFPNPQIFEYDSLTSQSRWDDNFSCILANPPFMSPKGGIKPHERYAIKSKRSEVLFVEYMMEHLTEDGKAGIIVPEGIIFQSQKAHKELRKKMVEENFLWAVVSLPAGVFQPYSGVKTSVLLFDKKIAKASDRIVFAKVENDGFSLGSQRQPIDKNDLPYIAEKLYNNIAIQETDEKLKNITIVEKTKLAENDYNLSGDRYFEEIVINSKWDMVEISDFCEIRRGTSITKKNLIEGNIPVIAGGQQPAYYHNVANRTGKTITVSGSGAYAGYINFFDFPIFASDSSTIQSKDEECLLTDLVYYLLKGIQQKIYKLQSGMGQPHVYAKDLKQIKIPLPPLEIQKEIVAEIEGYQKIIDGAKQVVENYKPHIDIDPEWDVVELGEISEPITKGTTPTSIGFKFEESGVNYIKIQNIGNSGTISSTNFSFISSECHNRLKRSQLKENDILFSIAGTKMGITGLVVKEFIPANTNQALAIIRATNDIRPKFLLHYLMSDKIKNHIFRQKIGVAQFNLSLKQVSELRIPVPPYKTQQQIISKIEEEQKYVDGCKKLIEIYEQKIKARIDKVWEG